MTLLCCRLMGESQQSVATYPNQSCDLRHSCAYMFLVFPPAATQTDRQTDRQTACHIALFRSDSLRLTRAQI